MVGPLVSEPRHTYLVYADGMVIEAGALLASASAHAAEAGLHATGALGPINAFRLDELRASCARRGWWSGSTNVAGPRSS